MRHLKRMADQALCNYIAVLEADHAAVIEEIREIPALDEHAPLAQEVRRVQRELAAAKAEFQTRAVA